MTRTRKIIITSAAVVALIGGGAAVAVAQQNPGDPDLDGAAQSALDEVGEGEVVGVEQDDDGGYDVEIRLPDGSETEVEMSDAFEITHTEQDSEDDGGEPDDLSVDDTTRTRAADAALATVENGTVVSVESDDGGYEVEIRHVDGTETDVHLDAAFTVTSSEHDPDQNDD